ncbi:hypothetical protein Cylst_6495 (plasmid) [Cylindrospermum stagnale PCC 7417]|uniref:Uncharacterized protein n=1 Tax=Cylindrospermum stagnale PCC 7417 TaxID=56107 RepID=K9X875_9NOST|nr:hypothetical protein [Cylindrospermum stagnale]AFZ28276.1 hypothetical protein Cylst_6495 [Cylindrospermum stagnale PCC 7417]
MQDLDQLLSQWKPQQAQPLLWGEAQKVTPEDDDGDRLEQSIREVFSSKQLLNKALATFLGVFTANCGVSLMSSLGISAIASGTLGSIVLGLFLANTLSKLSYDGRIHIDQDFILAAAQTVSVGAALFLAFDEYRTVSNASITGKQRFYQEVKEYEVKPTPSSNAPWLVVGVVAFAVLAVAAVLRGKR